MSRSTPTINTPNPATRWMEWKGGDNFGLVYYDKEKKERVAIKLPFSFILLDRLASVTGYNNKLKTGLRSNAVRDTTAEQFVVKFGTGGMAASGLWRDIKDKVKGLGGKFCTHAYVAFKSDTGLKIGILQLSGCALGPWFEFEKANTEPVESSVAGQQVQRIYSAAITIRAGTENTEGPIPFTPPAFEITACSSETNLAAVALDRQLQVYFAEYFKRPRVEQAAHDEADEREEEPEPPREQPEPQIEDDDIPF